MSLNLKFPTLFYIESTNDCNLSCIMCPRNKSEREVGYMPMELFSEIIEQLPHQRITCLTLHRLGEPLLHPQIVQMVRYAKNKGISYVRFATNATLLNEDLSRELIVSGLDSITISMDTACAQRYCPKVNKEGVFPELDDNILQFIELRNKLKLDSPKVHMQIINMPSTQDLIDSFIKKWQVVADSVTVKQLLSWAGQIKVYNKTISSSRLICINHLTQGVIQWDGTVRFCCLYIDNCNDSNGILGNAKEQSLEDIFLGKKRHNIIESQLKGNYEVVRSCKACTDWNDYLAGFKQKKEVVLS